MAKQEQKIVKPEGFSELAKLKDEDFTPNGTVWCFTDFVMLSDGINAPLKGQIYRYSLAPEKLYFTTDSGVFLENIKFYQTITK